MRLENQWHSVSLLCYFLFLPHFATYYWINTRENWIYLLNCWLQLFKICTKSTDNIIHFFVYGKWPHQLCWRLARAFTKRSSSDMQNKITLSKLSIKANVFFPEPFQGQHPRKLSPNLDGFKKQQKLGQRYNKSMQSSSFVNFCLISEGTREK